MRPGHAASPNVDLSASPRTYFPVEFKLEVIEFAKTHSQKETAEKFLISIQRVSDWCRLEGRFRFSLLRGEGVTTSARILEDEANFESRMLEWVHEQQDKGVPINKELFCAAAAEKFPAIPKSHPGCASKYSASFAPSYGWIRAFLKKQDLSLHGLQNIPRWW